jgi:hypothetical protein
MPYVDILTANSFALNPKTIFYEFGDETLSEILKRAYPDLTQQDAYIVIGDEIMHEWSLDIGTCVLLGEHILVYMRPYVNVEVMRIETDQTYTYLLPNRNTVQDLEYLLSAKNILKHNERIASTDNSLLSAHIDTEDNIARFYIEIARQFQIYIKSLTGVTIALRVDANWTVKRLKDTIEVIEGYTPDTQKLVYAGKELASDSVLRDYEIESESTVLLILNLRGGAGEFGFVDVSSAKGPAKIAWDPNAPSWRLARPGLCLEGTCSNQECVAYKHLVIVNMGKKITYQMGVSINATVCPSCDEHVEATTCAFNRCEWRYFGVKKLESGQKKRIKGEWRTADNNYYRFDPELNGTVEWVCLALESRASKDDSLTESCDTFQSESSKLVVENFEVLYLFERENLIFEIKVLDYFLVSRV